MNLEIQNIKTVADFPSGSGIVWHQGKFFAIGDDSPFLYAIDVDFNLIEKFSIFEENLENFKGNRIKKKHKPDFETFEKISDNEMIILGSGSKLPQRGILIRVFLNDTISFEKYSISEFYQQIAQRPEFFNSELNIEAVAFAEGFLYLFNRKNNLIIKIDYQQFIEFITKGKNFPKIQTKQIKLPHLQGIEAGFSGATMLSSSEIVFTASVENTKNSYDDGKILGSLVGILDISDFENASVEQFCWIDQPDALKVESVCISNPTENRNNEIVLITDDDNGNTQLIKAYIIR